MTAGEHRVFKATLTVLPETVAFVESFSSVNGIERDVVLRLTLIVEELFTNTVVHGYGGESDSPIYITLSVEGDAIGLLYEDAASRYDPLARLYESPPDLAAPLESRSVGGLGIHLVRELTENARYAHEDGRNRLWLTLAYRRTLG